MATLGALKAAIASDLGRDDLAAQTAGKIADAIACYENERFWFNVSRNFTLTTVPGQAAYASADGTAVADFIRIDAVFLPRNQSIYPLDRFEPVDFEIVAGGMAGSGRPTAFATIDDTLRLWPTPLLALSLRLHAHHRLPALAGDDDGNAWTTDAEHLVRTHAKMLLYLDVLDDAEAATRMQAQLPGLLANLRQQTSARMATGMIEPAGW
jgi:hypothetical protein